MLLLMSIFYFGLVSSKMTSAQYDCYKSCKKNPEIKGCQSDDDDQMTSCELLLRMDTNMEDGVFIKFNNKPMKPQALVQSTSTTPSPTTNDKVKRNSNMNM